MLSHLHKDHSGGIKEEKNGKSVLSFSNAVYYINKSEMDFAFENAPASYITEELEILKHSNQVELLNNNGLIDHYIKYEVSGGHSPFHQVFWIEENGEIVFYGGDVAPQLQQMKNRFIAKYDYDGKRSMELRQVWKERGEREKWIFLFYHDIKSPVFKF